MSINMHQNHINACVLLLLFIRLGVFRAQEENGSGGSHSGRVDIGDGGLILFAFDTQTVQSMQIDKQ